MLKTRHELRVFIEDDNQPAPLPLREIKQLLSKIDCAGVRVVAVQKIASEAVPCRKRRK